MGSFKLMSEKQISIITTQMGYMDNKQMSLLQNFAFAINRKDAKGKLVIDAGTLEIKVLTKQLKSASTVIATDKVAHNIKVDEAESTVPKQTTFGKSNFGKTLKAQ